MKKQFKLFRHKDHKDIWYVAVFNDCYAITEKGSKTWTVFNGPPTSWFEGSNVAQPVRKSILPATRLAKLEYEVESGLCF